MIIEVRKYYNTRSQGVAYIDSMIHGNEATPPVPDEYRGSILGGPLLPPCTRQNGWVSAWGVDGSSTCLPALDCVSDYTGPLPIEYRAIGKMYVQPYLYKNISAIGRMNLVEVHGTSRYLASGLMGVM